MVAQPETRYASSDAGYVAYQVFGEGPISTLFITSWAQNLDVMWDEPGLARYMGRLASFSQVVCFDKRGSGVSDPVPWNTLPSLEEWMDDARMVLDAAGVEQTAVIGDVEGGPMAILFAATYPERVSALVLINTFARWQRDTDHPIGMPEQTLRKLTDAYEEHWGVDASILDLTAPTAARDPRFRDWYTRYQRLAMSPGARLRGIGGSRISMFAWHCRQSRLRLSWRLAPTPDTTDPHSAAIWPTTSPVPPTWSYQAPTPTRFKQVTPTQSWIRSSSS